MLVRSCLGVALAGWTAACASASVHKPGDEYLKAIRFEGNHRLGNTTLITGLALHRSLQNHRAPDPYLVQVDADRIRGEYLRRGYLDVDVRSRVERKGDASEVTYTVEEGVRATTRVVISGVPNDRDLPAARLRELLPLADGAPFDYAVYDLAKQPLLAAVQDAGYAHARLDASVITDRANHQATIELAFDAGPKCKFGKVEVVGIAGDLRGAIDDRLHFKPGDTYSNRALAETQRDVYAMQRFSTVAVAPDKTEGDVVDVKVSVSEGSRHEVKFGGGFGIDPTSYEVRGRAGYSIVGWPFPLDTLTFDFRPAYAYLRDGSGYEPRIRAVAKLERQDLFWTYTKGDVEVGYNFLTVEAYTSYGPHTALGFSTPLGWRKLRFRVGWALERLDFSHISPLIDPALETRLGLDHAQLVGEYLQTIALDLRDNPVEPTFGAFAEIRVREGTRAAGGDYNFIETVPDVRAYVPLGSVVFAARVRYGAFTGDVPVTERFFGGGAVGERGFSERRLSPYVAGDVMGTSTYVPYGGAAMIDTGIESRIPITTIRKMPVGGVVFLDGGDVTETAAALNLGNLHWAAGLGLRVHTLIGPIRADFGYRLNRTGATDPDPGSHYAFHVSIGEAY